MKNPNQYRVYHRTQHILIDNQIPGTQLTVIIEFNKKVIHVERYVNGQKVYDRTPGVTT